MGVRDGSCAEVMVSTLDEYYPDRFFRALGGKSPTDAEVERIAGQVQGLYGVDCPRTLAELLALCRDVPDGCVGDYCPWPVDDVLPTADANAFEFAVKEPFRIYPLFANLLPIGSSGCGDCWVVALSESGGAPEVHLCYHDEGYEPHEVADSLVSFAFIQHLQGKEQLTDEEVQLLDGRVAVVRDLALDPEPPHPFRSSLQRADLFARAEGLATHLAGNYLGSTPRAPSAKLIEAVRSHRIVLPAEPLMVLWTLFFRKDEDTLRHILPDCSQHPSRVVRDAATILKEILTQGRKRIGTIEDIHELRRQALGG